MKRLLLALIILPLLTAQEWSYIGIPYVTDNVPDEIMPDLPDPNTMVTGFPYDPCGLATPTFADGANQYYVDSQNGNDGTAGNSGRGSVANPRQSLPDYTDSVWSLTAGRQVFITDNSTFFAGGTDVRVESNGTSGSVCWIIGLGTQPVFGNDKFNLHGQHLIVDNINFTQSSGGCRIKVGNATGVSYISYFTLRNSTIDGEGHGRNAAIGGGGISDAYPRVEFICIYNNVIKELGQWNRQDKLGKDKHGIQPGGLSSYWWIIDNEIFHCEGDSIQINSSQKNDAVYANRPHYIWMAGNTMYENYENAIDNKNCYHAIASENLIWGFHNDFKGANNTSFILANDSEGTLSSLQWAINNTLYDVGQGFKVASTAAETLNAGLDTQTLGQRTYILNNLIYDAGTGIEIDARSTTVETPGGDVDTWAYESWIVNNTIVTTNRSIKQARTSNSALEPQTNYVEGNILYNTGTPDYDVVTNPLEGSTFSFKYNVAYNSGRNVVLGTFDVDVGNTLNIDPSFVGLGSADYSLNTGSPAIDVSGFTEPDPYQLFADLYGMDIRTDYVGFTRPDNTVWDAGALEYDSGNPPVAAAPVITSQPQNVTVDVPNEVLISVSATGNPSPTYQWKKATVDISGATSSSYSINPSVTGDSGSYTVVVTNTEGNVTSSASTVTVNAASLSAPVFTTHPTGDSLVEGQSITFTSLATGNPAPTYQWKKDTVNISGETAATYEIGSLVTGDAGSFTVVATNSEGSATSDAAVLTVSPAAGNPPVITTQPQAVTVNAPDPITLTIAATGDAPVTYQWWQWSIKLTEETGTSLTIPITNVSMDQLRYDCVVTNPHGSTVSSEIRITVNAEVGGTLPDAPSNFKAR